MGQHTAAEAADGEDDQLASRDTAMGVLEVGGRRACKRDHRPFGHARIASTDIQRVLAQVDQLHAQSESPFVH